MSEPVNYKHVAAHVRISGELLRDAGSPIMDLLNREIDEAMKDITVGPRYGPPRPIPPIEYCECCGRELDE